MLDISGSGSMRNGKIGSGGKGEETDQTKEGEGEESVDTEAANEEDKGDKSPEM